MLPTKEAHQAGGFMPTAGIKNNFSNSLLDFTGVTRSNLLTTTQFLKRIEYKVDNPAAANHDFSSGWLT
jgi:hypothetical protein